MIKNALRDDREEEHPALAEADGRFDELLVDEDAVEDGEGRAEQHHGQSAQSSKRPKHTERDMRLEANINETTDTISHCDITDRRPQTDVAIKSTRNMNTV